MSCLFFVYSSNGRLRVTLILGTFLEKIAACSGVAGVQSSMISFIAVVRSSAAVIGQRKKVFSGSVHSRRHTSFIMQLRHGRRTSIAFLHVVCLLSKTSEFL